MLDTLDRTQLFDSCLKLLHYTLPFTAADLDLEFYLGTDHFGGASFPAPREILLSSSLFTRIDDCHGAGVCCRVPFDLIYSSFDRQRIEEFDYTRANKDYGLLSANQFKDNRTKLLSALEEVKVVVNGVRSFSLYVLRNRTINKLSSNTSCPFLAMGKDRYWCGVHPFKPLHCWMPHMTVRATESEDRERPSVSIGRNQYGRNHKFGCPVQFIASKVAPEVHEAANNNYFADGGQYDRDYAKLEWLSSCAASMGFTKSTNRAVGIHQEFQGRANTIRSLLTKGGDPSSITIYKRGEPSLT